MKFTLTRTTAVNMSLVLFAFVLPISKALSNAAMALAIVLWIVEGDWKRKIEILRRCKAFLFFVLFLGWLALSMLWSETLTGGFWSSHYRSAPEFFLRNYLFDFMIVPVLLTSLRKDFISYLTSAFLSAMFVSELFSWGIFTGIVHYKNIPQNDPSPFMHHSFYSIFLAVTIFLLAEKFQEWRGGASRVFAALFMLSAIVNLFLNGGRLGQIAFFVALVVYVAVRYRTGWKAVVLSMMLGAGIFAVAYKFSPIFHQRVDAAIASMQRWYHGDYATSWGIRAKTIEISAGILKEHPILGVGMGDARRVFKVRAWEETHNGFFNILRHLHNGYLQIWMDAGAIGLLFFGMMMFSFFNMRLPLHYRRFFIAFLTVYLVGFVGEPLFINRQPFMLFGLFVALGMWYDSRRRNEEGR